MTEREPAKREHEEQPFQLDEGHLRLIVQNSLDVVTVLSWDGTVLYVNPAGERVLGYPAQERVGRKAFDLVHAGDQDKVLQALARAVQEPGTPVSLDFRARHRDGSWRVMESLGQACDLAGGRRVVFVNSRDMTPYHDTQTFLEQRVQERSAELTRQVEAATRAQQALQHGERLWRTLFDVSPVGLGLLDVDGQVVKANPALRRLCGSSQRTLVEAGWAACVDEHNPEKVAEQLETLQSGTVESIPVDKRLRLDDGRVVWGRGSLAAIRDDDGQLRNLLLTIEDVTARKEIELQLEASRASLARAQRIAQVGSWEWDIASGQLSWSDEIYQVFGLAANEFPATYEAFLEAVHPDDRALVVEAVNRAVAGEEAYSIVHRVVRPDGSERTVHELGEVTFNADGAPLSMTGTVHDITKVRELDARLRAVNARVSDILDSISGHFFAVDAEWRVTFMNREFEEHLLKRGQSAAELIGRALWKDYRPEIDEEAYRELLRAHDERVAVEVDSYFPPSERWSRVQAYPTGEGLAIHIRDVTPEKQAQAGREGAELERQKFVALVENSGDFIGISTLGGEVTYINGAGREMVGLEDLVAVKQSRLEALTGGDDPVQWQLIVATAIQEGLWRGEFSLRHTRTGREIPVELTALQIRDPRSGKAVALAVVARDITERKVLESKLIHAASHDPLTGVPNRTVFMEKLERTLRRGKHERAPIFAVLFVDLDDFKQVNDTWGHAAGDSLLDETARRLEAALRPGDIVGRLGGDEFAVLVDDLTRPADAERLRERLATTLNYPLAIGGAELRISASIGIAHSTDRDFASAEEMLAAADVAMYEVKARRKAGST